MDKFMMQFNEKTNSKFSYLRTNRVRVMLNKAADGKIPVEVVLLAPYSAYSKVTERETLREITEATIAIMPDVFDVKVQIKRAHCTEKAVKDVLVQFSSKSFITIMQQLTQDNLKINLNGDYVSIEMTLEPFIRGTIERTNYVSELIEELEHNFTEQFAVKITYLDTDTITPEEETAPIETILSSSNVPYVLGATLYGKHALSKATKISVVNKAESKFETICGFVKSVRSGVSVSSGKPYYIFKIDDSTGMITVKIFPKTPNQQLDNVSENEQIVCCGKVSLDKDFGGGGRRYHSMIATSCSYCDIDVSAIDRSINYNPVPRFYKTVKPMPVVSAYQSSFFSMNKAYKDDDEVDITSVTTPECSRYLRDKTFVVLDFETTGMNFSEDHIIEIGAVKIKNGAIVESFSTLIKPPVVIPQQITQITGITNEMVAGSPPIEDVIGDFNKFTDGCRLVAHNAAFDIPFLREAGDKHLFRFDNEYDCTLKLSRSLLKLEGHSLAELCKHYKIENKGAHRAVNDAEATAHIFIKLTELM